MIVAKKRGLVYFFLQPVLEDVVQRIRRNGEVGQLIDEREDAGAAHGDARDTGVALRLAGLREDLYAVAFCAAAQHAVIEQILFQMQRRALLCFDVFCVNQAFVSHGVLPPKSIEP